jgi:hypothetical protein
MSNAEGKKLIRVAALDEADAVKWREEQIAIVKMYKKHDPERFDKYMGFPEDLPNLAALLPPKNTKPEGVVNSRFQQHHDGSLPVTYG